MLQAKATYVEFQDVLDEFDLAWVVRGLIVTRSNLEVTWNGPQMGTIT